MLNQVLIAESAVARIREIDDYLERLPNDDERSLEANKSFRRQLVHLITCRQDHDGPLLIQNDFAPYSLLWQHGKSGYHGGLIFHRTYSKEEGETQFGTWSIHT